MLGKAVEAGFQPASGGRILESCPGSAGGVDAAALAGWKPASTVARFASAVLALWLTMVPAGSEAQANWPRWRGPQDNGSIGAGAYPVKWDVTNLLWSVELPGKGCSTPVVWEKRIFLTAPTNNLDAVLAFDWAGKPLWATTLGREQAGRHRNGSGSNPSPATDGKGLFVYFKSGNLAGLEFDGTVRWRTNLIDGFGPETLYWDQGTSPVLTENAVVIARMHHGESWLAAFDKATGQIRWKVARNYETPVEGDNAYSTPLIVQEQGKEAVLVWGGQHLTAHDAADGKLLWSCGEFNPDSSPNWPAVASPVLAGDVVVVACGRSDRGQPRLYGVKMGGAGDVTATHRVWERKDTGTFVPTPAEYQGRVYVLRDRGEIECLDPGTGKTVWRDAFPKASSNYYASPLIAGGHIYAAREDGVVFVGRVAGGFEVLAENKMGERVIASPVPVANRLLLRGERHLFCVGGG
ncbi:MAG TPA: PQQ-binding-like beta-propeller repeat protein [Candidatus Binatia bacterium]|nr:PQQ-binding-like beta-propeller repeat protein [Candidatus Binatia bacterium]